ncbi:hypothetical protein L7F22_052920 [Adiantum nelumboides]|nr:hypothetical protein [Adiantum nelumboides]
MSSTFDYLRTLPSIRERCKKVFELAKLDQLEYFTFHSEKEERAIAFCTKIIERDFGGKVEQIPPHGRWRHFDAANLPRITTLLTQFHNEKVQPIEAARRLVDLFVVSVLLDAGAGPTWEYEERKTGLRIGRSEGLAVASLDMFESGLFSRDEDEGGDGVRQKCEAKALARLTPELLSISLQVDPNTNPMYGLEGRAGLLSRLGDVLQKDALGYFKGPQEGVLPEAKRPGFLIDYLANHPSTTKTADGKVAVQVSTLWKALIEGLAPVWPTEGRTVLDGHVLGDVWKCTALEKAGAKGSDALVPFHKLSQWLCYSIMEPMEQTLGWTFVGGEHQTGLPEYRNGGLLIDLEVLEPKPALYAASAKSAGPPPTGPIPIFQPSHPAVVEWRALTVIMLDRIAAGIREAMNLRDDQLNLKQVLEAATWKGGREIAKIKRPETGGGPPINIDSDGTVF